MKSRFHLLNSGLFPETLPPCFISKDSRRAFRGLVRKLKSEMFRGRKAEYIRYSSTKHDGSRRYFGTPNIISYYYISRFIYKNWEKFEENFSVSTFSIGSPEVIDEEGDRSIKVPSLSELTSVSSERLRYAPVVLKADIAQCFPSIYTHSIPWAAHGIDESKSDTSIKSKENYFNELDFYVRNAQKGNTRGVLVGPDAYRLIAEFVLSRIDVVLNQRIGEKIIGAARHVDDYYIGLSSEYEAQSVLSALRETLADFELNLNDQKTQIYSSLDPINDIWAQRLRDHMVFQTWMPGNAKLERAISEAVLAARNVGSDSPLKILLRSFDEHRVYNFRQWSFIEQNLQRIVQKHPHAIDYSCLLVAKRHAIGEPIDSEGWLAVASSIIQRSLAHNHHHETVWLFWLLLVCDVEIPDYLVDALSKSKNAHIRALLVQAFVDKKISRKPKLGLGAPLSSTDENWLVNIVARSQGFSKASFSGAFSYEFEHLAKRRIKLIDLDDHMSRVKAIESRAISRSRYGYDDEDDDDDDNWLDGEF